jgi:hypothetical protein
MSPCQKKVAAFNFDEQWENVVLVADWYHPACF